jgi:hypothetical protein
MDGLSAFLQDVDFSTVQVQLPDSGQVWMRSKNVVGMISAGNGMTAFVSGSSRYAH